MRPLTRRDLLRSTVFGGFALVAGCARGSEPANPPVREPGARTVQEDGSFDSAAFGRRQVRWRLVVPDQPLGLVVALHGRGGSANDVFDQLDGSAVAASTGLALASVDGAESYWHRRRDGSDAGAMVLTELLPLLAGKGIATDRIGLTGLSMGGYGALLLATQLPPQRVIGVAAMSSALWQRAGDSAAGAFDNREDFQAHDVFARLAALRKVPIRLACGTADPFIAANRALAARLPHAEAHFDPGGHDDGYWRSQFPAGMRWLAKQADQRRASPTP